MDLNNLTHNDLPKAVSEILKRLGSIESHIANHSDDEGEEDHLLNTKEAAKFLQVALPTLYSKVGKREIPHIKKNKRILFLKSELIEYLKSGRRDTQSVKNTLNSAEVDTKLSSGKRAR